MRVAVISVGIVGTASVSEEVVICGLREPIPWTPKKERRRMTFLFLRSV